MSRADTSMVVQAFMGRTAHKTVANTHTDGTTLTLHGNTIAEWKADGLYITDAGWPTVLTRDRLSHIPGIHLTTVKSHQTLNGTLWDGNLTRIMDADGNPVPFLGSKEGAEWMLGWAKRSRREGALRGWECH